MSNMPTNILDLIGNTPLVPINRLNTHKNVQIYAKLESFNPGGSIKDRVALSMIKGAMAREELTKDKIVLEASSGNTGIGLAMICAVLGFRCKIAMSEGASVERRRIMEAYGADIILTPAHQGTDGAIETVYKLARNNPELYFCTDQFNNDDNWKAHYNSTATEIWEQTQGNVDVIVITMGTTGTLMGITKRFKELNPNVKIVGMEPYLGHKIQGLKNMKESYRPGIYNKHLPDVISHVADEEAFEMTRRLAREEGIFVGMSSGAALVCALKQAESMEKGVIVTIFPDGGERYLSAQLFGCPLGKNSAKNDEVAFFNTLSRRIEAFQSSSSKQIGIYSCGPTAYEHAHLNILRRLVASDLLRRTLEMKGYEVKQVVNITDIDDKTIKAAIASNQSLQELTESYAQSLKKDFDRLGIKPASVYPKASEHMPEMIELTQKLLSKGFAYVKHGSVYFDISKLPSYGRLSRVDIKKLDIGCTVDLDDYEKDSPVDFTLLKRVTLDELKRGIGYETEWGMVRPGLHIECVAMSMKYLGEYFDIHTSDKSLIFPHHENEIAISTAITGKPLAKHWLHNEPVCLDGKKMSLANNNVLTLKDIEENGFSPRELRFYLLRTHYRKPIDFSFAHLEESTKALKKVDSAFLRLTQCIADKNLSKQSDGILTNDHKRSGHITKIAHEEQKAFRTALFNDFNISLCLASLYKLAKITNTVTENASSTSLEDLNCILDVFIEMDNALGLFFDIEPAEQTHQAPCNSAEIEGLMAKREEAKQNRDFHEADRIRNILKDKGIHILDTKDGSKWTIITK